MSIIKKLKYELIQLLKEYFLYKLPLLKPYKNTILIINLEAIGDYVLLRNFLPYLKKSPLFEGKRIVYVGDASLKDFVERFDKDIFDDYIWVNLWDMSKMSLWQRFLFLRNTVRKYCAKTAIVTSHFRLSIEELFIHGSGAKYKIAPEGDDIMLWRDLKIRMDKLYDNLIPSLPYSTFQFKRNQYFFQQLIGEEIPIKRTSIEGVICKKNKHLISLYPGASASFRRWSAQNFAQLAALIYQQFPDFSFLILGASWEVPIGLDIIKNLPDNFPIQSLCGQTRLDEVIEKIAESSLLISNETSGPHFAAALDIPCICISNGNHFGRFHPYPSTMANHSVTVYPSDDFYVVQNFDFLAEQYCRWQNSEKLSDINTISPQRVFDFVKKLLEKTA
jgi:ADP-heptose:LPS heptosyltransferase